MTIPDETFATATSTMSDFQFKRHILIFRITRQVAPDAFEYQLEEEHKEPKYAFLMYRRIVEIEEPIDAISLDNLSAKLRNNFDLKDLLIRYFNENQIN